MRTDRLLAFVLVASLLLAAPGQAPAALCGDTSGDGSVTATDALATLKLAVGGGDDRRGDVSPAGNPDGKLTAADALTTLKAAVLGTIPPCRGAVAGRAVVTTAPEDFHSSGGFAVVDIATRSFTYRGGSITGDAVVRVPDGKPIVVNRRANSLQVLDTSKNNLPNVKECSVAQAGLDWTNPQDVLLKSATKGYVTAYGGASLLIVSPPILFNPAVDPACSGLVTGHVDLSSFDSDGIPQMDQMLLVGNTLFVSLQLLDAAFQPKQNSVVVAIDTTTDTVTGSIPLSFANPFAETKGLAWDEFQKRIFVGGPGKIGDSLDDGGIEALDPATMQSKGMILTGADLHANIFDFVIVGTKRAFAIIADNNSNSVVDINLATRSIHKVLLSSTALITDIEMTELGELWVAYRYADGGGPPGIRIYRVTDDVELTVTADPVPKPKPIALPQEPFTLAFLP